MKKLFIIALATLGMFACSDFNKPTDNGDNKGDNTNKKDISCDVDSLQFVFNKGGSQTITLTATGEWNATTNAAWLTIEPMTGTGNAFVTVTCKTGDPAEGKIMFSTATASIQVTVYRVDNYPDGFWVSPTKQVAFAKGNLQFQPSTGTWRFAEHQYDIIGHQVNADNIGSSTYSGWLDLFALGTSGYEGRNPNVRLNIYWTYFDNVSSIAGTNYDWGVYCKISNGGNQAGLWRLLTREEGSYLDTGRPNAKKLQGCAIVNGIKGYIYLPQGWNCPLGLTFISLYDSNYETIYNEYDASSWVIMEKSGAVFLPYAGNVRFELPQSGHGDWRILNWDGWAYACSDVNKSLMDSYSCAENLFISVRLVQDVE